MRGGRGNEHEVSLLTGANVLENLPERCRGYDIFISRDGQWHFSGSSTTPERAVKQVDVIFNALHGEYGEDGKVQNLLDVLGAPYTGSGSFASAVAMNKDLTKRVLGRAGFCLPRGFSWRAPLAPEESSAAAEDFAFSVFRRLGPPWLVKPLDRGSSVGVSLARNFSELAGAIRNVLPYSVNVLVEEFISGREATVGVVERFRGVEYYSLPTIEVRLPDGKKIWTYEDKYSGATAEICPGCFSDEEKRALEGLAVEAHRQLGLRHYSRADFIVPACRRGGSPRGIYLLEVNTLPGLTRESLFPKALEAVGCSYTGFLDHLIGLALGEEKK